METYYQWIATDMNFPLKFCERKWATDLVEYRHVKMVPVADSFFQFPHPYLPID
jgi:hypothetical protein